METYCTNDCSKCGGICYYDQKPHNCSVCGTALNDSEAYEYRGSISCADCHEENTKRREAERQEVIAIHKHKTDRFRGLDLSDSQIGKANRQILKTDIEIAKKEDGITKRYERGG